MKSLAVLLTVLGKDRPGIIAAVTKTLYNNGCNLEDVAMTILEGEFAMILVVRMPANARFKKIQTSLSNLKSKGLSCSWKSFFPKRHVKSRTNGATSYIVSAVGRDRTGIVYKISRVLADYKLNITDMQSRVTGSVKNPLYAMFLEVDVPKYFPKSKLERSFANLARQLKIEIKIKPVERISF